MTQPRTGQFLKPQPLDRSATDVKPGDDPRVTLAAWITDPKNESFSGAMVNRLWRHFLGVGLVEPVDDLRASNPPTNPELWQALNKEFVGHKFDLKHLMRLILNSRTYQLTSATRPGNADRHALLLALLRPPAAGRGAARRPEPERPACRTASPATRSACGPCQLPDPTLKSYFLTLFGRSERVTACACERSGEVTMPQLLHLQNGDERGAEDPRRRRAGWRQLLKEKKTDDAGDRGVVPGDAVAAAVGDGDGRR